MLLFGAFSTVASAEGSTSINDLFVRYVVCDKSCTPFFYGDSFTLTQIESGSFPQGGVYGLLHPSLNTNDVFFHYLEFSSYDDIWTLGEQVIFKKGENVSFSLKNFDSSITIFTEDGRDSTFTWGGSVHPEQEAFVQVFDYNGNIQTIPFKSVGEFGFVGSWLNSYEGAYFNYVDVGEMPFDVYKFRIFLPYRMNEYEDMSTYTNLVDFVNTYGMLSSTQMWDFTNLDLHFDVDSSETGFFKSILEWLKNIKNGISNLGESISQLPSKIGNFIIDGLKSLFVPSEDYFTGTDSSPGYSDRWDELLSSRFGAIYQIGGKVVEFAETILTAMSGDTLDTIKFPEVHIPLLGKGSGVKESLLFGGWNVSIKVEGLQFFYTAIKSASGVAGTFLFFKGLRRRYDEVMGVET